MLILHDALPGYYQPPVIDLSDCDRYDNLFEQKWQVRDLTLEMQLTLSLMTTAPAIQMYQHVFNLPHLSADPTGYFTACFVYSKDDYLQWHVDTAIHQQRRKAVVLLLYLSECSGGNLLVKDHMLHPTIGTLVAFRNDDDAYHQVLPVIAGSRLVLTTGLVLDDARPLTGMERLNERAAFAPHPSEQWTPEQYALAEQRLV